MNISIREVAKKAETSTATVSHVINKTRFVSEELTNRVKVAILELGYQPNEIARGLRRGGSKTIGLILPDNSNPFFAELARYITDIGFENDFSVILCNSNEDLDREAIFINTLVAKQVEGIIFIASHASSNHSGILKSRNIPSVVIDRDISVAIGDVVLVNNEQGGYQATNYLIQLGHRKIGCISGPSTLTPSADRVKGYKRALQEAKIKSRREYIHVGNFLPKSGDIAMSLLLALNDRPTAVFVCNDMMAIGAKHRIELASLRVPEDISIVGFDDILFASTMTPALTTIAQPVKEMAVKATSLLIDRIQNGRSKSDMKRIVLDTHLVIRNSCRILETTKIT